MTPVFGFLFPGQGSQSVGMGKPLFDSSSTVQALYKEATDILGYDVGALCFDGPSEQLNQTEFTQPALLVTSLAAFQLVKDGPLIPAAVAGHSLGEYTALVAAGALGFREAVSLVQKRGHFMAEAVVPEVGWLQRYSAFRKRMFEVCVRKRGLWELSRRPILILPGKP